MNNTIACKNIKEDHMSRASTGCDLDIVVSGNSDLLPTCCLKLGISGGDVLALQGSSGNHMAEKHSSESFLVSKQTVQGICRNFLESRICRSEDCERTLARQGVHKISSLHCSEEGREVRVAHNQFSNGLWGRLDSRRTVVNLVGTVVNYWMYTVVNRMNTVVNYWMNWTTMMYLSMMYKELAWPVACSKAMITYNVTPIVQLMAAILHPKLCVR